MNLTNKQHTGEPSVVVVGAGLAGLTAAWRLRERLPKAKIIVCEASNQVGGILQTEVVGGYRIDRAADMFTTDPGDALELCRALGHESELQTTIPVEQRASIATESGVVPVPRGFSLMLPSDLNAIKKSGILEDAGFGRLLAEEHIPAKGGSAKSDEDFQSFVTRRLGQPAFERLVQPLVSGIYTADPTKLSMRATMQRFLDMVRDHGSLIAAARATAANAADRAASGARYDLFRAPVEGMGQLPRWLMEALRDVDVRFDWPVSSIERIDDQWVLKSQSSRQALIECDAVIVAAPVARAATMLSSVSATLASDMNAIESASCAVVVLAFDKRQLQRAFGGYGIVIPAFLNRDLIAASFSSNKFAGRAPAGKVLVRCFIGGAMRGELVDLPDEKLVATALHELNQLIPIDGKPELDRVYRWRAAMPQYHVGHLDRIATIKSAVDEFPLLALAGNGYEGVGIPICVRSGIAAADRIVLGIPQDS